MDAFWIGTTVGFGYLLFKAARKRAMQDSGYSSYSSLTNGGALAGTAGNGVPVISACVDGCACGSVDLAKAVTKATNPMRPGGWVYNGPSPAQLNLQGVGIGTATIGG
jgi:hypothetical protein